ncbi:MAG: hypothetical protein ACLPNY_18615, partial [Roseiarcus sp.]
MSAKKRVFESSTARIRRVLLAGCITLAVGWASATVAGPAEDLVAAAYRGDAAAVQALLANGAEVNARTSGGAFALLA